MNTIHSKENAYALNYDTDNIDATVLFGESQLAKIYDWQINHPFDPLWRNQLISLFVNEHLLGMRTDAALNTDITEIIQNMVPFDRVHYLTPTHSWLKSCESTAPTDRTQDITFQLFDPNYSWLNESFLKGEFLASTFVYWGDIIPKDVTLSGVKCKKEIKFVDWCPTGVKCGINYHAYN